MKLINCKLCKKQVADDAKTCPHCGTRKPRTSNIWSLSILVILILFLYFAFKNTENILPTNNQANTEIEQDIIKKIKTVPEQSQQPVKYSSENNPAEPEVIEQLGEISSRPSQFATVKEVIEDFNDYKAEDGSFKIIKNRPLHIQLSPTILGSSEYPNGADDSASIEWDVKHTLVYGIYTAFIHTPANEITVTSVPMVFNIKSRKHKYLKSHQKTLTITRQRALEMIQKYLPITSFDELKTDETIPNIEGIFHDQWTEEFKRVYYNGSGSPGLDVFFKELIE